MTYKDLMREFKEKGKDENHTKGMLVAKEQAILKDLIAEHKKCKCGSDKNLSLDHIIPLDILRSFMDVKREMLEGNYQASLLFLDPFLQKTDQHDSTIKEVFQIIVLLAPYVPLTLRHQQAKTM